jgi:hypothetical protein
VDGVVLLGSKDANRDGCRVKIRLWQFSTGLLRL